MVVHCTVGRALRGPGLLVQQGEGGILASESCRLLRRNPPLDFRRLPRFRLMPCLLEFKLLHLLQCSHAQGLTSLVRRGRHNFAMQLGFWEGSKLPSWVHVSQSLIGGSTASLVGLGFEFSLAGSEENFPSQVCFGLLSRHEGPGRTARWICVQHAWVSASRSLICLGKDLLAQSENKEQPWLVISQQQTLEPLCGSIASDVRKRF